VYPNARGFAAERFTSPYEPRDYALYRFDSQGEDLLDSGPGIDPRSISVFADALVWRHDGEQRSAPLR
jgi:hypothetical protein